MQLPHFNIDEQFFAIAAALGAEAGDEEYYRGLLGNAPFLFKIMSVEPPGYLLKFRMMEPRTEPSDWHEKLGAEYAGAGIRCEIEGDYVYLWIDDASQLSADAIAALATACVRDHARYFPPSASYCYDCQEIGAGTLVQSSNMIGLSCEACLARRLREKVAEDQRVNPSGITQSVLLPLALVVSAVGWGVFWHAYDFMYEMANARFLHLLALVVALAMVVVGGALGWPVGSLLHRSGLSRRVSPRLLATIVTLFMVAAGELSYAGYVVFDFTGRVDPVVTLRVLPELAFGYPIYAACKLMVAGALGVVIYEVAKPRAVTLRV